MRILLIHRYFWPDTPPYAAMLRSIGQKLVAEGHDVTVLSSQPSYKPGVLLEQQPHIENLDGMTVHRLLLFQEKGRNVIFQLINMVYFPLRIILFSLLKGKFDIIMASTAPPVVVGFAAALGAKITRASFFYHCMDIHPEIGRISGEFRNPIVFSFLRTLDTISCRIARRVIVLSKDMQRSLLSRPKYTKNNIQVINNFSMPFHGKSIDAPPDLLKKTNNFRVIFTGNIGRFQGLEAFVDAMKALTHRPAIELVFVGEGNSLRSLKKRADGMKNIRFLPHQSVDIARKLISDADLGIISLASDIYQFAYPSKTMTYLAEGCPVLVAVEPKSELANLISTSSAGVLVSPDKPESISKVIESIYLDEAYNRRLRYSAKKVGETMFSEQATLQKWASLIVNTN